MWSGPRNISTAMMRSWEARGDTHVCDEPLYAHYLKTTGTLHPGAREIIDTGECNWRKVVYGLAHGQANGKPIYYQKHMAKHYLPGMDLKWLDPLTNCFLIREPRAVLASFRKLMKQFDILETGFPQQLEIFEYVRNTTGRIPAVIDSRDVLQHPESMLRKLCETIGVEYTPRMLQWEPGRRDSDGIWARYWYGSVEKSTGFAPYRECNELLPRKLSGMAEACEEMYWKLYQHRITP